MKQCETCRAKLVPNVGANLARPEVVVLWWSCEVCDYATPSEEWPRVLLSSALGTLAPVSAHGADGLQPAGVA